MYYIYPGTINTENNKCYQKAMYTFLKYSVDSLIHKASLLSFPTLINNALTAITGTRYLAGNNCCFLCHLTQFQPCRNYNVF